MTENTEISMETIIEVYSAAIVLASQPLYGLHDADICNKSNFVGDVVDRIQQKLNDFSGGPNPDLTIDKSLFARWIKSSKKNCTYLLDRHWSVGKRDKHYIAKLLALMITITLLYF